MRADIFAEGSNTTAEDRAKPAEEYFQGSFRMVAGLTDELSELADTRTHILSEKFGVLRGDQPIAGATMTGQDDSTNLWESAQRELLTAAGEAGIIVILLSTNTFERTAGEIWSELVEKAKSDSIWCIGVAQSSLDSVDFEELEHKGCSVITYQRVGVARIGVDTRKDLLQAVERRTTR